MSQKAPHEGMVREDSDNLIVWRWPDAQPQPTASQAQVCSPAQGLVALYALHGITESDIASTIAAIPDPARKYTAQIGFSRATEWRSDSPTMLALANLLGLGDSELAELFEKAATVAV